MLSLIINKFAKFLWIWYNILCWCTILVYKAIMRVGLKIYIRSIAAWSFMSFAHYAQFCVRLWSKELRIMYNGIYVNPFFVEDFKRLYIFKVNFIQFILYNAIALPWVSMGDFDYLMKLCLQKRIIITFILKENF